ncbi:tyrosine-type recombinase/integrase [Streptomyces sp. NBC_00055]|uniref:tyrosine-type recombinase/integrase n=1 Tax=Streptomyces sp. NBC_00055 TaxID=2975632 RepID=UPI003244EEB0
MGTAETDRQLTDSTRLMYSADMAAFTAWCGSIGRRPLPATPETVTEYVAHLTVTPSPQTGRPLAPGSINRILTAVRAAHRADALPAPETEGARKVLSGYRKRLTAAKGRAEARAARPRRAGPSAPDALREMLATLDQDTLIGKRDAALLLLGYACTAHVSELVSLDQADAVETNAGLLVTLYRRPLKRHDKVAVPYGPTPATCPVWAVRALLAALNAKGRTDGPLFVRIDRHDRITPPMTHHALSVGAPSGRITPTVAAAIVTRAAMLAGFEGQWTGHSLRRGFDTAARRASRET